ncbi:hypothetical protein [Cesiribacter sp. SM1]|uniref:hypothetical protein n=1 Tax=Cesiribacter sp. SM1 TaxID=2861196 RepID=UPI001CD777FB|nr:hypothetical protein [Cesiribacter sp. SM1]
MKVDFLLAEQLSEFRFPVAVKAFLFSLVNPKLFPTESDLHDIIFIAILFIAFPLIGSRPDRLMSISKELKNYFLN